MLEIDAIQKLGSATVEVTLATPTDGVLALFGPSGAGKTTILNWLAARIAAASAWTAPPCSTARPA